MRKYGVKYRTIVDEDMNIVKNVYSPILYINNEEIKENYLQDGVQTELKHEIGFDDFIVPENCIFAMGDNRAGSIDCRDFGCIPLEKIEGTVWIRIFPFNKFGKI